MDALAVVTPDQAARARISSSVGVLLCCHYVSASAMAAAVMMTQRRSR